MLQKMCGGSICIGKSSGSMLHSSHSLQVTSWRDTSTEALSISSDTVMLMDSAIGLTERFSVVSRQL